MGRKKSITITTGSILKQTSFSLLPSCPLSSGTTSKSKTTHPPPAAPSLHTLPTQRRCRSTGISETCHCTDATGTLVLSTGNGLRAEQEGWSCRDRSQLGSLHRRPKLPPAAARHRRGRTPAALLQGEPTPRKAVHSLTHCCVRQTNGVTADHPACSASPIGAL